GQDRAVARDVRPRAARPPLVPLRARLGARRGCPPPRRAPPHPGRREMTETISARTALELPPPSPIGERLRGARRQAGLTVRDVAARLGGSPGPRHHTQR